MMNAFLTLTRNEKSRLIQSSMLMLFVELVLIRWAGSNLVNLFFFTNFILIASFLGIGLGFVRSNTSKSLFRFAPIFLTLLLFICYRYRYEYQVKLNPITDDLNLYDLYFTGNLFPVWISLPIVFILVTMTMMMVASGVARSFQTFSPLQAYRWEILGSMLGVVLFTLLSFLSVPPFCWGIVICLLFTSLLLPEWHIKKPFTYVQLLTLITLLFVFVSDAITTKNVWSPYYKIAVQAYSHGRYAVNVNGLPQQFIESVAQRKKYKPFYFLPYQYRNEKASLDKVLVIGAGTGGDVAIALAKGAKQVDAVEIDPELYHLGRELNPNHPYDDDRVRVHIEDGRAFLQKSTELYDMIIFALPDSLTILSRQSSLRLENYLFTLQAISLVKDHLTPDGVFTMYNYYRLKWIVDRLANTLTTVFHHTPCLNTDGANNLWLSVLSISPNANALQCESRWESVSEAYAKPIIDDYPFLYLKEKHITPYYIIALLFILLSAYIGLKMVGVSYQPIKHYLDLFFMGAAFLLLETKSIVNFALLFGTTWLVNALVFVGILFSVYLSIEVTHRIKLPSARTLYLILLLTLLTAYSIPPDYLLYLSLYPRFLAAAVLTFSPVFIANLIFTTRFKQTQQSSQAFGVNIMGAVCGGLLEYLSLLAGYHSLIILIAILYTMAIYLMWQRKTVA